MMKKLLKHYMKKKNRIEKIIERKEGLIDTFLNHVELLEETSM